MDAMLLACAHGLDLVCAGGLVRAGGSCAGGLVVVVLWWENVVFYTAGGRAPRIPMGETAMEAYEVGVVVKKEDEVDTRMEEGEGEGRREDARVVVESRVEGEKGMVSEGRGGGGREGEDPAARRGTEESGRVGSTMVARVGDGGGEASSNDDDPSSLGRIELK